jgi:ATP-dependent exoDNAse (exonuclease V) beta subunit
MVHKAVELWLFPENPNLKPLLKKIAINEGISEKTLRDRTVSKAIALLERLKSHPVFTEIDTAAERFHELPYSELINGFPQTGYMDLLYKLGDKWKLIDFKTDAIFSEVQKNQLRQEYSIQANRYRDALHSQIGINPNVRICFLDDQGKVVLYEIC